MNPILHRFNFTLEASLPSVRPNQFIRLIAANRLDRHCPIIQLPDLKSQKNPRHPRMKSNPQNRGPGLQRNEMRPRHDTNELGFDQVTAARKEKNVGTPIRNNSGRIILDDYSCPETFHERSQVR